MSYIPYTVPDSSAISKLPAYGNNEASRLAQKVEWITVVNTATNSGLYHARLFLAFYEASAISVDPNPNYNTMVTTGEMPIVVILNVRDTATTDNPSKTPDFKLQTNYAVTAANILAITTCSGTSLLPRVLVAATGAPWLSRNWRPTILYKGVAIAALKAGKLARAGLLEAPASPFHASRVALFEKPQHSC
ncbi:hypothetical protein VKT23_018131 [Stygiomarasmius scandens]|uniref:Uncharacterized protein n=1 Tax=Marasmiellus scandens TaxID=2682957 RepID=A0ABR1IRN6_9AGAR